MSTPEINLQLDNFLEQKGLLGTEKPAVGPAAPTIQQSLNSSLDSFLKYKGYELPGDLPNEKPPEPTPEMRGYMAKEFQPSKAQPSFVSTPSTTEGEPPKIEMTPGLEPTFWKQAKDLALAWAKGKIGPEDIGGVDLFKRLTLGNVDPYAIVEKISGKPGFKEMAETATRAKVVSAVGYEPKRAVAFSRGAAGAIGNVLAFAPILKGAQVTAKLLPAIPMLRAVARGVVAGALAGAIEKPEDEGAWNRLKQIPPNVLFFTAFETVGLAASQALKIFEWNLEYGKFRKGGPAGGQTVEYISKEVPGVGKTVGAENFTAQEMKDLFGKMQANVAGTGGEWSKVTPREQFVINEMAKPPGWKRAVKEGFFSEGTFIPGEPTTIYGAKVKPELVPRKPQMGDVFRNEAGLPKYQPTIAEQEMWPSRWPREGQPSPVEPPIPGGSAAGPTATPGPTPPPPPPSGAKAGPKVTPGVSGGEPRAVVPVGKTTINIRPQADGSIKVEVEPNQVPWPADELWIKAEEAKAAVAAGEETPTPPVPKPKKRWSDWNPPRADKYPARDRSEMTGLEAFRYDDKMGGLPRKGYVPPRSPKLSDEYYLNKEMREFYSDILRTGEVKWGDLTSEEVALLERIFEPEEIEAFKAKPRLGPHGETLGEFTGAGYQGADREQVREEYRKWYASMAKPKPPAQGSLFGAEVAQIPPNLPAERATAVVEPKTQAGGYTPTGKSLPAAPPEIKAFDPRFKEAIDLIDSTWTTDALIKERQLKRKLTGEELSVIRDAELKRNGIDPALPMEQWESAWMEKRGITQPQTPTGNIPAPKRISPKKLTQEIQSEPGYVYHATNEERLYDIADTGTLKTHKPHEFTDQSVWPDGSTQKRAYFSGKADIVWQFSPEGGKPVVIRTRGEGLKTESTGDIFSDKPLPTTGLEYLGEDGAWHPVQSLKQPATQPQPSGIPEAKPTVEIQPPFTEEMAKAKEAEKKAKAEAEYQASLKSGTIERAPKPEVPVREFTDTEKAVIVDGIAKLTSGSRTPKAWRTSREIVEENRAELVRQALLKLPEATPEAIKKFVYGYAPHIQGGELMTREAQARAKTIQYPRRKKGDTLEGVGMDSAESFTASQLPGAAPKPKGKNIIEDVAETEKQRQRTDELHDFVNRLADEHEATIADPKEKALFAKWKKLQDAPLKEQERLLKSQGIKVSDDTLGKYVKKWSGELGKKKQAVIEFLRQRSEVEDIIDREFVKPEGRVKSGGTLPPRPGEPKVNQPKYAGSINLERIDEGVELKDIILKESERWGDFEKNRRKGMSYEEITELADAIDKSPEDMSRVIRSKTKDLPEAMVHFRDILATAAQDVQKIAVENLSNPSIEGEAKFALAFKRFEYILGNAESGASEVGRTLSAFNILSKAKEFTAVRNYKAILKRIGSQAKNADIMRLLASLDPNDPIAMAKFLRKAIKTTLPDKLYEAWLSGLLSNPKTWGKNFLSNLIAAPAMPLVRNLAGIWDLRRGNKREISLLETPAMVMSLKAGIRDGVRRMRTAWQNEMTMAQMSKIETARYGAIPGKLGKYIRTGMRVLMSTDELFKGAIRMADIYAMATRQSMAEGKKGQARLSRIQELIKNPTADMEGRATGEALYYTFQKELGRGGKWAMKTREEFWPFKLVFPFIRTPINIAKFGLQHTPFHFMDILYKATKGKLKGTELSTELGKASLGTLTAIAIALSVADGDITGSAPINKNEREAFYRQGKKPYSLRVKFPTSDKSYWIGYGPLEPWGTSVGVISDFLININKLKGQDIDKVANLLLNSMYRNMMSKTFNTGAINTLDVLSGEPGSIGKMVKSLAGSIVPSNLAAIAGAIDPSLREARTILDKILARTPVASKSLLPRRDVFGEEVARSMGWVGRLISPVEIAPVQNKEIESELQRLGIFPGLPDRKVREKELTAEQYDEYVRYSGGLMKTWLLEALETEGYKDQPDAVKERILRGRITSAREFARLELFKDSYFPKENE